MEGGQELAVLRNYLGCKFALRIFEFFERRDVSEGPYGQKQKRYDGYGC